jgi:ABC-type multidrug transport system fused ATPase/permease subunit
MKLRSSVFTAEPRLAAMAAVPTTRTVVSPLARSGSVGIHLMRLSGVIERKLMDWKRPEYGFRLRAQQPKLIDISTTCVDRVEQIVSTDSIPIMGLRMMKTVTLAVLVAVSMGMACPSGGMPMPGAFASLAVALPAISAEAMATAFRSAWAGLAAGCLHTLAGADHLAALTPLTIGQSHLRASMLGALWGFGHSTGQLLLGLLMVILKDRFQQLVPALSKWGGTTVGLTLLAIGALGVYESFFEGDHDHHHDHATPKSSDKKEKKGFGLATFATGIVYGLQPDALFVIIPALALPTKLAAMAYILMFVLGTVAAMGAYAGVIGATSQAIKKTNTRLTSKLSGAASAMAILIGFGILLNGFGISTPFALA